jgi:hypothetical protein
MARMFTLVRDRLAYVRKSLKRRYETAQSLGKSLTEVSELDMARLAVVPHKASRWTHDDEAWRDYGERGRAKAALNMNKLAALLAAQGVALTIVVYPWPDQIFNDPQAVRHQGFWREWALQNGARFVSLFPAFTRLSPDEALQGFFIPGDFHWNEAGNKLAAEAFLAQFAEGKTPCP